MGGLALGSYLAGRVADKIHRPFLWYGILEGVIGVWALLAPFLFDAATPLYRFIWLNFHLSAVPFGLLRFFAALVILLLPTTCMGATLPLLAKFVTRSLDYVGERIGTLYAANTLGAVAGAAVAGLVFLPTLGLNKTTMIAATINFLLIVAVVLISRAIEGPEAASGSSVCATADATDQNGATKPVPAADSRRLSPEVVATMACFALSGAIAMIYEVGWTRTLLMVIGSSTYAFTLMLTSFLLGIFLGSLVCARLIDKAKEPLAWLALIQLLVGAASLLCMGRFNSIPFWNLQLNTAFPNDPDTAMAARFFIASSIMMPLTFFLGAVFPAAVKVCVKDLSAVGRSIGSLYSCNTIGAIIGAFLAGFVLIPVLGVEKSLIASTVINIFIGVLLLFFVRSMRQSMKMIALAGAVLGAGYLLMRPQVWDRDSLVYAQSARRYLIHTPHFDSLDEWKKWVAAQNKLIFYEDGASSTVAVLRSEEGIHSLVTNGHMDASDHEFDMSTQVLLAAGPIAANPAAKDVAIIGWGSGVTIGTAARMTGGHVTVIELEPAVIKTSEHFHGVNRAAEKDPRVSIEINDGRNFLLATDQKFDVIISEPSNPWQAGVCNLFTREYFKLCKDRLRPKGVFGLWCQTAEVPGQNIRGIFAALHDYFPYCAILRMDKWNIVGLGSETPISIDIDQLRELMKNKELMADLHRAKIDSPEELMSRFCVAPAAMEKFIGDAPANDDDTNRLEYDVGRTYENQNSLDANMKLFNEDRGGLSALLSTKDKTPEQTAATMCEIAKEAQFEDNFTRAEEWAQASLQARATAEGYRLSGINHFQLGNTEKAYSAWKKALEIDPRNIATMQTLGLSYEATSPEKARQEFQRILEIEPGNSLARLRLAQTYGPDLVHGVLLKEARTQLNPQEVLKLTPALLKDKVFVQAHPGVFYLTALSRYALGNMEEALESANEFSAANPNAACAKQLSAEIYTALKRRSEAEEATKQLHEIGQKIAPSIVHGAQALISQRQYEAALKDLEAARILSPTNKDLPAAIDQLCRVYPKADKVLHAAQ